MKGSWLTFSLSLTLIFPFILLAKPASLLIGYSKNLLPPAGLERDFGQGFQKWIQNVRQNEPSTIAPTLFTFDCINPINCAQELKTKKADVLGFSLLDYILMKDKVDYSGSFIATPLEQSIPIAHLLVVPAKRKITKITDLNGYSLTIPPDSGGANAMLWVNTLLLKNKKPKADKFFKDIKTTRHHSDNRSIYDIYFQKKRAIIITRFNLDVILRQNTALEKAVKILNTGPPHTFGVVAIRNELSEEKKKIIKALFQSPDSMPAYKQLFNLLEVKDFIPNDGTFIEPTEKLVEEYKKLNNGNQNGIQIPVK